ncbi:hypothetical protein NDU88_000690 [Pleurodeles waltl]|uniref:Uncharacterized protein n=1 Tax=Pleurodeles waltl TaxID=8319 RepID=A0AAV7VXB3_PLEWA|nr:hypothetical protein NDU88_000690 [Pleurodeles waltl]
MAGGVLLGSWAVAGGALLGSWAVAGGILLGSWAVAGGVLLGSWAVAGGGLLASDDGAGGGLLGSDDGAGGGLLGSDDEAGSGLLGSDDGAGGGLLANENDGGLLHRAAPPRLPGFLLPLPHLGSSPHSPRGPFERLGWLESSPSPAGHWPTSGASHGGDWLCCGSVTHWLSWWPVHSTYL